MVSNVKVYFYPVKRALHVHLTALSITCILLNSALNLKTKSNNRKNNADSRLIKVTV